MKKCDHRMCPKRVSAGGGVRCWGNRCPIRPCCRQGKQMAATGGLYLWIKFHASSRQCLSQPADVWRLRKKHVVQGTGIRILVAHPRMGSRSGTNLTARMRIRPGPHLPPRAPHRANLPRKDGCVASMKARISASRLSWIACRWAGTHNSASIGG